MRKVKNGLILFLVINLGCIEPYQFTVENEEPTLVVEGFISNVSYNESRDYPSSGRYFTVDLRYTNDVINLKDEVVQNATVKVVNKSGEEWAYSESPDVPGQYILNDPNFKVVMGQEYKLKIDIPERDSYESEWEKMEQTAPTSMGEISFEEIEKQVYLMKAGKEVLSTIQGINVYIDIPENEMRKSAFYRWDFDPLWIYIAPLASSAQSDKQCWATNKNYLADYTLQKDNIGGYKKELFFMETVRNERIFEGFSVLIRQFSMSEDFFYFWKEMQEQSQVAGLFDNPPFNLESNIQSVNSDEKVSGYFGVVEEKATRWYFEKEDLSYFVMNTLKGDCEVDYGGPPSPSCFSCLEYTNGVATTSKPVWWE